RATPRGAPRGTRSTTPGRWRTALRQGDVDVGGAVVRRRLHLGGQRRVVRPQRAMGAAPCAHAEDCAAGDLGEQGGREQQVVEVLVGRAVAERPRTTTVVELRMG